MQRDAYLFNGPVCLQLINVLIVYYLQMLHSPFGEAFGIYAAGIDWCIRYAQFLVETEKNKGVWKKIVGFQIQNIIYDIFEFSLHLVNEK